MGRLQKDQDGVEPMDSVKPNFSGAHEELLEDAVSIEDIDEVLEKLATAGIAGTETDEPVIGEASSSAARPDDDDVPEEMELDLSAGELDKTSDPVRVYMREMGVVPLLKREQEVSIAKRIEWGQKRAQKGITRSPAAVAELLKIGTELEAGTIGIRDVVTFPIRWRPKSTRTRRKSISRGPSKAFRIFAGSINEELRSWPKCGRSRSCDVARVRESWFACAAKLPGRGWR